MLQVSLEKQSPSPAKQKVQHQENVQLQFLDLSDVTMGKAERVQVNTTKTHEGA